MTGHPDWNDLLDGRRTGAEPVGWSAAVAHGRECSECRRRAITLDPTLAFTLMAPVTVDRDEVTEMKRRVSVLVRSREIGSGDRRPEGRRWGRNVAAAVLLVATSLVGGARLPSPPPTEVAEAEGRPSAPRSRPGSLVVPASVSSDLLAEPVFEASEEGFDKVWQFSDGEVAVVLVVDDRFDV